MYGLPHNINLGFFDGKTLVQVCFGVHDLILNFDDDVSITVTSSLGYVDSSNNIHQHDDFRQIAVIVLALLNQSVLSAEGNDKGTLTLKFDGGGMLTIYDNSKKYESYTIKNGEQMIIV